MLPCDMIVVSAGNRPNTDFLDSSGIKLDRGVMVDKHMCTSNLDVYAAGDVTGIAGTWYAAVKQGRVAGQNMANPERTIYEDEFNAASTINYGGMTTLSIGKVTPPFGGYKVIIERSDDNYFKLVIKDGNVEGVLLFGDISNAGHWKYIVKNAVPLNHLGKSLRFTEYADFFEIDSHTAEFRYNVRSC